MTPAPGTKRRTSPDRGLSAVTVRFPLLRLMQVFGLVFVIGMLPTSCSITPPVVREHRWLKFDTRSQQKVADHLSDAAKAWDQLKFMTPSNPDYLDAREKYNNAVAEIVQTWAGRQRPLKWQNGRVFMVKRRLLQPPSEVPERYTVDLLPSGKVLSPYREFSPLLFDTLRRADRIRISRGCTVAEDKGLGAAVIGQIMRSDEHAEKYPMLPLNGASLSLTAVIEFGAHESGKPRQARLRLLNPLAQSQITVGKHKEPLTVNYTAAKELALNDGFLAKFSFLGLLQPAKIMDKAGLYVLDPYDPKRIPVVFVHGLVSDPHIWYNAINAIYCDPQLRARYQPWYFLYPTGLGVPNNAKRLRDALDAARDLLDPDHNDPGMNRMVLVGHSMGGLLSRMQVIDSKDKFWKAYFTRSPEEMKMDAETKKRVVEPLIFEKRSFVKRVIFVATPHRGSKLANISIVYHLSNLINLPFDSLRATEELLTGDESVLVPQLREWGLFSFLSIGTLSPKHPYFKALNGEPIPVPHHSIIGRIGRKPLEQSSDGAVPYSSAHLDTGTEVVVRHWHSCVDKKDVIDEIVKRLKQHAQIKELN